MGAKCGNRDRRTLPAGSKLTSQALIRLRRLAALKGRNPIPWGSRPKSSTRKPGFYPALSGLDTVLRPKPRAMPSFLHRTPRWGWEGVVRRADTGRWEGFHELAWGTAEGRAAATEVPAWGFAGFLLGFGREIGSGPLGGGIGIGGAPALHDLDLGFFALLFIANG